MTIWRMACWPSKATYIDSEYVILIAFPLQQCFHESPSMLRYKYIVCLVRSCLSTGQEIALLLWNPKADYCVKVSPTLGHILSKMIPLNHVTSIILRPILVLFSNLNRGFI
jgi:hypothetical protein